MSDKMVNVELHTPPIRVFFFDDNQLSRVNLLSVELEKLSA